MSHLLTHVGLCTYPTYKDDENFGELGEWDIQIHTNDIYQEMRLLSLSCGDSITLDKFDFLAITKRKMKSYSDGTSVWRSLQK